MVKQQHYIYANTIYRAIQEDLLCVNLMKDSGCRLVLYRMENCESKMLILISVRTWQMKNGEWELEFTLNGK